MARADFDLMDLEYEQLKQEVEDWRRQLRGLGRTSVDGTATLNLPDWASDAVLPRLKTPLKQA